MTTFPGVGHAPNAADRDGLQRPNREMLVNFAMATLAVGCGLFNSDDVLRGFHGYPTALRFADVAFGVVSVAGIWLWRVRWPVGFALFAIPVGVFSTLAGWVALAAVFTVAVHRPWRPAVAVSLLGAASVAPTLFLYSGVAHRATDVVAGMLLTFAVTGWGMFVRARRLLVASLRAQVAQADASARRAERERIAREMHDVLAHRLSLLAVHAGALEFRRDATAEEVADASGVIRANAHQALNDLRSVIAVLRENDPDADQTRPQPTMADLEALIGESRHAGLAVSLRRGRDVIDHADSLAPEIGRTVYCVIQEGLTNVRKHANFSRVWVQLEGQVGDTMHVCVCNQITGNSDRAAPTLRMPGSGTGLIGLRERTALAGGGLDYGPSDDGRSFVLRAWLPWPAPSGDGGSLRSAPERPSRPEPPSSEGDRGARPTCPGPAVPMANRPQEWRE